MRSSCVPCSTTWPSLRTMIRSAKGENKTKKFKQKVNKKKKQVQTRLDNGSQSMSDKNACARFIQQSSVNVLHKL